MKGPGRAGVLGRLRLLPPAPSAYDILASVAIQITHAQPMSEPNRAGNDLPGRTRLADRVHFPRLRGIAAGREPGHLPFVVLAFGLPAHHQHSMAITEKVGIKRRLVAGAMPDLVPGPVARVSFGVFVPSGRLAG